MTARVARRARHVLALVIAVLCTSLSACGGSTRSVAAVCGVWDSEGLALHNKYEAADRAEKSGGLAAMFGVFASAIGAPNEIAHLMGHMAEVAPAESQPDFEAVASSFKELSESEAGAVTDPLGTLGKSLVESVAVAGSYDRVNAFLAKNCGIPSSS